MSTTNNSNKLLKYSSFILFISCCLNLTLVLTVYSTNQIVTSLALYDLLMFVPVHACSNIFVVNKILDIFNDLCVIGT